MKQRVFALCLIPNIREANDATPEWKRSESAMFTRTIIRRSGNRDELRSLRGRHHPQPRIPFAWASKRSRSSEAYYLKLARLDQLAVNHGISSWSVSSLLFHRLSFSTFRSFFFFKQHFQLRRESFTRLKKSIFKRGNDESFRFSVLLEC